MTNRFASLVSYKQPLTVFTVMQIVVMGIAIIILVFLSITVGAFQWSQINRTYLPPIATVSPTSSNANSSSVSPLDEQILSEAQQDLTVANNIIAWSGIFLTFIAGISAIAGFLGISEFRRIQELRQAFEKDRQEIDQAKAQSKDELEKLVMRFENESKTFMEVAYNLGVANDAYKLGDNERAVTYYLRVLKLRPEDVIVMERLGRAYNNLDQMQTAVDYLNQALAINPSDVPALRSLALCYRYRDKDKAIDYLQRALQLKANDYEGWDILGLIYRDNGQIDEAIAAHEQAKSLKQRPETFFFLSILYAMKGDKKLATLMSLNAEQALHEKEHDERLRPVWKILIRAGVPIIEGKIDEAIQLIKAEDLMNFIRTQRNYEAVTGHLKFLLEAIGHKDAIDKFTDILKEKVV